MSHSGGTEFFNLSILALDVLRLIASGEIHRREIEDKLRISEKNTLRAIDKLREAGLIRVDEARDPGRAGMGVRLYRCTITETGYMLIAVCDRIERHRRKSHDTPAV